MAATGAGRSAHGRPGDGGDGSRWSTALRTGEDVGGEASGASPASSLARPWRQAAVVGRRVGRRTRGVAGRRRSWDGKDAAHSGTVTAETEVAARYRAELGVHGQGRVGLELECSASSTVHMGWHGASGEGREAGVAGERGGCTGGGALAAVFIAAHEGTGNDTSMPRRRG